ncbi:hypothetical protein BOX15_Mlig006113g1 [Macrostomum lignano]|uniref:Uncharacterized protein n=1 Tax=Macrostomum lignano TaxID=282301 RepID=A0A267FJM2_9PLAT|nr:hypothetical protein BOX15_Mlig006113g1 [Macrostomum lignano]
MLVPDSVASDERLLASVTDGRWPMVPDTCSLTKYWFVAQPPPLPAVMRAIEACLQMEPVCYDLLCCMP